MKRMTLEELDEKFGPVYDLIAKAREAHANLTKGKKGDQPASAEETAKLKAAAEAATKAALEAQEPFGEQDIYSLVDYLTRAIISNATVNGKQDTGRILWSSEMYRTVKDERHLPRADKDKAARRFSRSEFVKRELQALAEGAATVGYVLRDGMRPRDVQEVLERLGRKHEQLKAESKHLLAKRAEDQADKIRRAFPKSWQQKQDERQERPQPKQAEGVSERLAQATAKGGAPKKGGKKQTS